MSTTLRLLPFQPFSMTTAQLAAVSFFARYAGTHELYSYQLHRWFQWWEGNGLELIRFLQVALRVLEAHRGERTTGPLILRPTWGKPIDRRDAYLMVARVAKAAGTPRHISPQSLRHAA